MGRHYALDNFSAFKTPYELQVWMTSEHAYQGAKFEVGGEVWFAILTAPSAHDSKQIARNNKGQIRKDWDDVKLQVMEDVCRSKFESHEYVRKTLKRTGNLEIIEDSPTDSFWGRGPDHKGLNHLGKIWMKIREEQFPNNNEHT